MNSRGRLYSRGECKNRIGHLLRNIKTRNISLRLTTQLIISFMAISLIILFISTGLIYTGMVDILKKRSENDTLRQFQQMEHNINTFKNEVDKISRLLIISRGFQDYIESNFSSNYEASRLVNSIYESLTQMINNYDYIESIFYFSESGIIIGASLFRNDFLDDKEKKNPFYSSEIYKTIKADNRDIHWFGGYTSLDFDIYYELNKGGNSTRYITAARSVNYLGKQTATLVVNINERYFTSIYNSSNIASDNNMFIMDRKGKIISHIMESKINSVSELFSEPALAEPFGSLTASNGNGETQVVWYHLGKSGWILISEIPLNLLIKDVSKLKEILALMVIVSLVIALGTSVYWIYRITKPLKELTAAMHEMEKGKLGHMLPESSKNELGFLVKQFNKMSGSILQLINQVHDIEREKRKAEIEALQAQINPHFLYNALNTIKYMAVINNSNNIADSISALGSILRPVFQHRDVLCTIEEEVEYVRNYIKIMNYRFGEGIRVDIDIPGELMKCEILRFILQPLIENSISHGIFSQGRKGLISITAHEECGNINIIVEDNGGGMDESRLQEIKDLLSGKIKAISSGGNGIGLVNVNQRIRLHFGESYGISVASELGTGTRITVKIPAVQKT